MDVRCTIGRFWQQSSLRLAWAAMHPTARNQLQQPLLNYAASYSLETALMHHVVLDGDS